MRDFVLTSIPDLTQRFPEGFGGVDMTPGNYIGPLPYDGWFDDYDPEDYEDEDGEFELRDLGIL